MSATATHGIILNTADWGQAGQLFTIYSQQLGKIRAVARGVKKVTSKLAGHLQPFSIIELELAHGRGFEHITGVSTVKPFLRISEQYEVVLSAAFAMELIDQLTDLGQADEQLWELLVDYFLFLDTNPPTSREELKIYRRKFVIKLLTVLGYQPPETVAKDPKQLSYFLRDHLRQPLKTSQYFR